MKDTPHILQVQAEYSVPKEVIERLILNHYNISHGHIVWDISNKGSVRGVVVRVVRSEIQHVK